MCFAPSTPLPPFTDTYERPSDDSFMTEIGRLCSGCLEHWPRSITYGSSQYDESDVLMIRYIWGHGRRNLPGTMSLPPDPSVPAFASYPSAAHPTTWNGKATFTPPRHMSDALHWKYSYRTAFKEYEGERLNGDVDLASAGMRVDLVMVSNGTIHPVVYRV